MAFDLATLPAQLAAGDLTGISTLFARNRRAVPTIVWNPAPIALPRGELQFLYEHWNRLRGDRAMACASDIRGEDMVPALGHIMLIDVVDEGRVFRYRLYGSDIADYSGGDWTGKTTAEMIADTGTTAPIFYDALYRAILLRPEPVFTSNTSVANLTTATWLRLVLPLDGGDGRITRFLVGNVPVFANHPGRKVRRSPRRATTGGQD